MSFVESVKEMRELARRIKKHPEGWTEKAIYDAIFNIKSRHLPSPERLTVGEFNWLVDYINEARPIVSNVSQKTVEKI